MKNPAQTIHSIEQHVIDKITSLRKQEKITAKRLGEIIHTSTSFVCNVENCNTPHKYNLKHIYEIALHFRKSPRYFLPA